jgi:hypothetical protein
MLLKETPPKSILLGASILAQDVYLVGETTIVSRGSTKDALWC